MKQGDKIPVTIAGQVVAQATVKELGDGTATLVVPGTLVVMAVRTEIAPETHEVAESSSETIITGVDRVNNDGELVDNLTVQRQPSAADAPVANEGTPEVSMPEVTAPGSDGPTNDGKPVADPVAPVETINPVVSDKPNEG